jgi:hypothetical protein
MWSVRIDALNGKLFEKMIWLFHANLIEFLMRMKKGSESWFTSFDNSYKQIYSPSSNTVVRGGKYRVIPFNSRVRIILTPSL